MSAASKFPNGYIGGFESEDGRVGVYVNGPTVELKCVATGILSMRNFMTAANAARLAALLTTAAGVVAKGPLQQMRKAGSIDG